MTLSEKHVQHLAASGIPVDVALRFGVYSASHEEGHRQFAVPGADRGANYAGIVFIYRHPVTGAHMFERLRPDVPVNGRKYLQPAGSRNHLYVPCLLAQQLSDTRFNVLLVEGEKKALALTAVVGTRYLVVGISGVWSWRTSDKEKQPEADRPGSRRIRKNSRPIEDFDYIAWKGRRVIVLFDSDGSRSLDVQSAETALVAHLRKLGAVPMVCTLPPGDNGDKQGIDDLLVREPEDQRRRVLESLLRDAAPRRKVSSRKRERLSLRFEAPGGFMRMFEEYVDPITDAPPEYRPYTALSILSAVVGRNVTGRFGSQFVIPNLYQCLLGQSSLFRKSTMIHIAEDFIAQSRPESVLPNEFSAEKLVNALAERSTGVFTWREFTGFLARSRRDYMSGSKELLMELYDCPPEYRRALQKETVRIQAPCVSILTAAATPWLAELLRGGDLRSGFLNRFCLVYADRKVKSYAMPDPPNQQLRQALLVELRDVGEIVGQVDFTRASSRYAAWKRDVDRDIERSDRPDVIAGFFTRLTVVALKYALLIELAKSKSTRVAEGTMEEAIELTDYLRAAVLHLLQGEFAESDAMQKLQTVMRVIRREPGIKKGWLLKKTGMLCRDLDPLIDTLVEQQDAYEVDGGFWPNE